MKKQSAQKQSSSTNKLRSGKIHAHKSTTNSGHYNEDSSSSSARSLSNRLIADYAIPFTRLVEAKLVRWQNRV